MSTDSDLWYALKVRPRCEWMVAHSLKAKGYDPFLPTYKSKRRWSDRTKILDFPLFPGYLFCQLDLKVRLPILITPGVNAIVGIGKNPEPIQESEIESIRTVIQSGLAFLPHPYLNVGQRVRIVQGSLDGIEGLITETKKEARLILSVSLLMRSVSIEIDRDWVEPIRGSIQEKFLPVAVNDSRASAFELSSKR